MFEEQIAAFNNEHTVRTDRDCGSVVRPASSSALREVHRMTYTVADVQQMLGIGETSAYKLCNSGAFKVLRIGNSIRISRPSFDQWLEAQL